MNRSIQEKAFFKVLEDLRDYLPYLVIVGGWVPSSDISSQTKSNKDEERPLLRLLYLEIYPQFRLFVT